MPGYEVLGFSGSWESTDALHCRIKGIPDLQMLQIFHNPINDSIPPEENGYRVDAIVDDLSESGLHFDSTKIFWKTDQINHWNESPLNYTNNSNTKSSGVDGYQHWLTVVIFIIMSRVRIHQKV